MWRDGLGRDSPVDTLDFPYLHLHAEDAAVFRLGPCLRDIIAPVHPRSQHTVGGAAKSTRHDAECGRAVGPVVADADAGAGERGLFEHFSRLRISVWRLLVCRQHDLREASIDSKKVRPVAVS